jgi:hypothetical protein
VIERSIHDHTRRNLLGRFKEYNANKRLSDRAVELQYEQFLKKEEEKVELAKQLRIEGGYAAVDDGGDLASESAGKAPSLDKTKLKVIPVEKNVRSSLRAPKGLVNPRSRKLGDKQLEGLRTLTEDAEGGGEEEISSTPVMKSESEAAIQRRVIANKKKRMVDAAGGRKKEKFAYRPYQFPAGINEKPMEWLFGDIDFL